MLQQKKTRKIRKDFSFNINTIKKLEHDNNNKHKIARVTKLNSTNGGAINTTRQIKSSRDCPRNLSIMPSRRIFHPNLCMQTKVIIIIIITIPIVI